VSYVLRTSVLLIPASVQYSLLRLRIAFSVSESEAVTADINNRLGCGSILKKAEGSLESQANFLLRYTII
jgi:hypothetical protein